MGARLREMPGVRASRRRFCALAGDASGGTMNLRRRRRTEGLVFLLLFGLSIPAANWLIGVALVLRDLVQRRLGLAVSALAVLAGAAFSALLAPPALVIASAVAFLLSEFADLAVYTPLARRRLVAAVAASSLVGLVVDSMVFLWLAFGSLEFLPGQIIGKAWMVLLAIPLIALLRRRDERLGLQPA